MASSSDDKVFVFSQSLGFGDDGTRRWAMVTATYVIMASDGSLVSLAPIGGDTAQAGVEVEFGDSRQGLQQKIIEKIIADFARTDLRFEFVGW